MLGSRADKYDDIERVADVTIEEAFDYAKANCQMQELAISEFFSNDLPS
jgi:hypothetical protein